MPKIQFDKKTFYSVIVLLWASATVSSQNNINEKETITPKQKSIVEIAALTATGKLDRLEDTFETALNNGLIINETKEAVVHVYAYCGFPRSIRGLQTLLTVIEERKNRGITDSLGKGATKIVDSRSKYDRGVETLEELLRTKLEGPKPAYQQFSPEIDSFLKEHLFADIFERDVLTYQERELATISVLIALGNLEPMLKSHLRICLIQGLTKDHLNDVIEVLSHLIESNKIEAAKKVVAEISTP